MRKYAKKIGFLFSIVMFMIIVDTGVVFARGEVVVESITPVYDENSGVVVNDNNGVIFNDKNQSIKYNVVLKNVGREELKVDSFELTSPTEDYLVFDLKGIKKNDVLKSDETMEFVVSLETVSKNGWGRNFNDNLKAVVNFESYVSNPNTLAGTGISIGTILVIAFLTLGFLVILIKNRKYKMIVPMLLLGIFLEIVSAKDLIKVTVDFNVKFESQNIMEKTSCEYDFVNGTSGCVDYWKYVKDIKNIFIQNEINEFVDYEYKFDVSKDKNERVMAYLVKNSNNSYYDLYLQSDGIIYANEDSSYYFVDMISLDKIDNIKGLDTSNVTNMKGMFINTGNKSDKFTLDLSSFNTSNVTNMRVMFYQTGYSNKDFTLNISNFDTSKVTDMTWMFYGTGYNSNNFELDVSKFDTSNVVSMKGMFYQTGYESKVLSLDLSNFNTSNVNDMSYMFFKTGYNSLNFKLNLENFDTSNVTTMVSMFEATGFNSTLLSIDLSSFDTKKVTDMSWMFYQTGYNSKEVSLDVSGLDTSNVTNMKGMFARCAYSSNNFITSITIGNPKLNIYNNMFADTALKGNSKIVVNYTNETSELVDKLINTKSASSNVVKGDLV